jgi:hypothetical protein
MLNFIFFKCRGYKYNTLMFIISLYWNLLNILQNNVLYKILQKYKSKSVLLHHVGAKGERRYSSCSFLMSALDGASGQCHAPAVLYPRGKDPLSPLDRRMGRLVWTQTVREKSFASAGDRTLIVQSAVRHYTD